MGWTLKSDGDSVERALGTDVCKHFYNYEQFWTKHVVPLTYRVMVRECIFVRAKVTKDFEDMATASYAAFVHLAACHQQLKSKPDRDLFAVEGVYAFYSRIYSVEEAVFKAFLPAVGKLVKRYSKQYIDADRDSNGLPKRGTRRYESRLEVNGRLGLHRDVNTAFKATKYRHQRVHKWGFPTRSGRVPGPAYIDRWVGKGLGELARTDGSRFALEFVDAIARARRDLQSVESALNEIWEMALKELADFKKPYSSRAYAKAQAPTKKDTIPSWWSPKDPLSSKTAVASGSVAL
jgi:hypothetical protein